MECSERGWRKKDSLFIRHPSNPREPVPARSHSHQQPARSVTPFICATRRPGTPFTQRPHPLQRPPNSPTEEALPFIELIEGETEDEAEAGSPRAHRHRQPAIATDWLGSLHDLISPFHISASPPAHIVSQFPKAISRIPAITAPEARSVIESVEPIRPFPARSLPWRTPLQLRLCAPRLLSRPLCAVRFTFFGLCAR